MPSHTDKKILPYTPEQMYALVADIERYPDFLPWCHKAIIRQRVGDSVVADLVIGFRSISDSFTSHVSFDKGRAISVRYGGGPLTHLSNEWRFEPAANGACLVSFFVDFGFRSRLLGKLMDSFFDVAFCRMVHAFEARALAIYGQPAR